TLSAHPALAVGVCAHPAHPASGSDHPTLGMVSAHPVHPERFPPIHLTLAGITPVTRKRAWSHFPPTPATRTHPTPSTPLQPQISVSERMSIPHPLPNPSRTGGEGSSSPTPSERLQETHR